MCATNKLNFACSHCGREYLIKESTHKGNCVKHEGLYTCRTCARPKKLYNALSIEEVQLRFSAAGWELLSEEYVNVNQPLEFRCITHPDTVQITSVAKLVRNTGCKACTRERKRKGKRKSGVSVWEEYKNSKYIPMFTMDEYTSCKDKLPYLCSLHQEEGIQYASIGNIRREQACPFCKRDKMSGENHFAWKGGVSKLKEHLRHHILPWKNLSMQACNFLCTISKGRFTHIHHLHSFESIVEEALVCQALDRRSTVSDYTDMEMQGLISKVLAIHYSYPLGVCLTKKLHDEFHSKYSRLAYTPEQFYEFYYSKTGEEFMPKYIKGDGNENVDHQRRTLLPQQYPNVGKQPRQETFQVCRSHESHHDSAA